MTKTNNFRVGRNIITIKNNVGKIEVKMEGPTNESEIHQVMDYIIKEGYINVDTNKTITIKVKVPVESPITQFKKGQFSTKTPNLEKETLQIDKIKRDLYFLKIAFVTIFIIEVLTYCI